MRASAIPNAKRKTAAMVEISITMDQLPRVVQGFTEQIPFAASQALNDTAFAVKKQMPTMMGDDLTLRNKFTAGGSIRFDKASKTNLVATVGSVAWYTVRNIDGGTTRPERGIEHNGKKYLLVPPKGRRNKAGRLKKIRRQLASKPFVIEAKSGALLLVSRTTDKRYPLFIFGKLEEQTEHEARFDWQGEVDAVIEKEFRIAFVSRMVRAARSAR